MPRPTHALLDRNRIGKAALALVDAKGDFTVPDLAKRLGVSPSSLYHHVDGRGDIVDLIRIEVVAKMDHARLMMPTWDEALRAWALSYRQAFADHPAAIRLLAIAPVRNPEVVDAYEQVARLLLEAGFAPDQVIALLVALESFLLGSALDLAAPEVMIDAVDAKGHPRLQSCLSAIPTDRPRADQAFDVGLQALLTGYAQLLTPTAS